MTLGEKIRELRKQRKMTQQELCRNKITRNMLSEIECNKANPSLSTLKHIADKLNVPVSYLVSDEVEFFFYQKNKHIKEIKIAFESENYTKCIEIINQISTCDDELYYILSYSYFQLGKRSVINGSLATGEKYLNLAIEYSSLTIYDTSKIKSQSLIYSALARNIQSPLLEFDKNAFEEKLDGEFDFELYKYIILDTEFPYKNEILKKHVKAREYIKARKYREAIILLKEIENERNSGNYNAYVVFGVYSDLENSYKQLADFENAYRYASKKLSLIEAFKT